MKQLIIGCSAFFMVMLTSSCNSTKSVDSAPVTGTEWELSTINGSAPIADEFNNGLPTINFTTDNKVNGKGGCNGYSGTYTLTDKGALTLGPLMSTKMFCPGGGENKYMAALQKANTTKVADGKLMLMNGTEEVLVFTKK
ncbi:META domain-containing protein [Flavobacterium zepuense]|uniref:META domain-containing protein n=1 Tax=Flavobacterium zepuense TaxID=2593302 RepID=A0A552V5N9_9FLAO|nr:META domain-containing protein [Flavobacterium zepuense]TRW25794.1 META domain-containing protein [Flavobacterium zepuense]